MAREISKLTARFVESVSRSGRHSNGGNLYLSISQNGGKSWASSIHVSLARHGGKAAQCPYLMFDVSNQNKFIYRALGIASSSS